MNAVSIKLIGGLCNYMFQIACVYAYSLKNAKKYIFTTDDSVVIHKHINEYKKNIFSNIEFFKNKNYKNFKVYNEPNFHYDEIPNYCTDVYLTGYYQSYKYFSKYEKEIKNLFKYPDIIIEKIKNKYYKLLSQKNCSIHIRRGDYVNQPEYHPIQNLNYYMKSIKKIGIDKNFLVFSDDINWCKENLPNLENFHFIENQKDYEDFLLMSLCDNNIIANSSFSWWAAWLNENPDKKVIAPNKWFGLAYAHWDTKDLIPESWIII